MESIFVGTHVLITGMFLYEENDMEQIKFLRNSVWMAESLYFIKHNDYIKSKFDRYPLIEWTTISW
ncbi:hypothetical protein ACIQZM_06395 [Peribacillus sp. NPDC097206]|uniref:hypothetical protein n=1 Tax=Peribacillus sp. NPDC097206 TaxID=3364398 RepID=UPI0037F689EF